MSNICDNNLYAEGSEETLDYIYDFLIKNFNANIDRDKSSLSAYFDSKWTFPEEEMEELYNNISNKENLYMRCLSVELGCLYHAIWVCDEDGWKVF